EHPRRARGQLRTAELLAVHLDAGALAQRRRDRALEFQVELGGEVVAALGDRAGRADAVHEALGGSVEDLTGDRQQIVQLGWRGWVGVRVGGHAWLSPVGGSGQRTAARASGRVNRPAYSALPTIAPSTPSGTRPAMATRSSMADTPPE